MTAGFAGYKKWVMVLLNPSSLTRLSKDDSYKTVKEGRLYEKQSYSGKWESRFGVLKGNLLFLFKKAKIDSDAIPVSMLILEDCVAELTEDEESGREFGFRIRFLTSGNTYSFATEDSDSLEQWVSHVATCSVEQLLLKLEGLNEAVEKLDKRESNAAAKRPTV